MLQRGSDAIWLSSRLACIPFFISRPTDRQPAMIKPRLRSFFAAAHKAFLPCEQATISKRVRGNRQKKFISALYFAASKDKLNFICSVLHRFLSSCAETRDIYSFGLVAKTAAAKWLRESAETHSRWRRSAREKKQFIREVSLWFNKSPDWERYLHSSQSFLLFLYARFLPSFHRKRKHCEDINPLFKIIQLFSFPATSSFVCENLFILSLMERHCVR